MSKIQSIFHKDMQLRYEIKYKNNLKKIQYGFNLDILEIKVFPTSKQKLQAIVEQIHKEALARWIKHSKMYFRSISQSFYLFGQEVKFKILSPDFGVMQLLAVSKTNKYDVLDTFTINPRYFQNEHKLYQRLNNYLLNELQKYIQKQHSAFGQKMQINDLFDIKIQENKKNWAVHYKSGVTKYSLKLYVFSYEQIDAVIYHELVHFYEFNHSAEFYKKLLSVCPNYYVLNNALNAGEILEVDN